MAMKRDIYSPRCLGARVLYYGAFVYERRDEGYARGEHVSGWVGCDAMRCAETEIKGTECQMNDGNSGRIG